MIAKSRELVSTIIEIIYRSQKCLICGVDFNIVGITGINKVLKSSCKTHPEPTFGQITETEYIHPKQLGGTGSCIICNSDRSSGNKMKKAMMEHCSYNLYEAGCTKICHSAKPWLSIQQNPTFQTEAKLKELYEKNIGNVVPGGYHNYNIKDNKKEIIVGNKFMDITGSLLILPLFVFKHIMNKQKKFSDPNRNWYNDNEFLIPYEEMDILPQHDTRLITEAEIASIYEYFSGKSMGSVGFSKNFKYSSSNCPETRMAIFESPARFVSEFVSLISKTSSVSKDIMDLLPNEKANDIESIVVTDPYIRLSSNSLVYKINLLGAYNSMLQTFNQKTLPRNYLQSKIAMSPYLKSMKQIIFPKLKHRKPPSLSSSSETIDLAGDNENEEDIPLKKKKRKNDDISTTQSEEKDEIKIDTDEDNSRKKRRTYADVKRHSDVLGSYIKEENNDEIPVHSHFYRTLKDVHTLETPKLLTPASKKRVIKSDSNLLSSDILFTSNPKTHELHRLQTEIRDYGIVGALDPSLGVTPTGTFASTVIPGINSESSRSSIREDTLTIAKMHKSINRVEKNTLATIASEKYNGYIEKMKYMIRTKQLGIEMMNEMQLAMSTTFGKNKKSDGSIYLKWNGISREGIDNGFVPFVILLNADYADLQ